MTVKQDGPSWVWWTVVRVRRWTLRKWWENLRGGFSDYHDGRAGRTVVGVTVRRKWPSLDTWKIFGDPFQRGLWPSWRPCRTDRREDNGPSQASLGRVLGLMRRTLRRSVVNTTDRHRGLVLNIRDRTVGTLSNPNEHIWSCSVVDLYVSIPTT